MSIETMNVAELQQLLVDVSNALAAAQEREANSAAARLGKISAAIDGVTNLLGPVGAEAGVESIRAVRAFDAADAAAGKERGQTLAENSGLALSLAFEALEVLAAITRDIAMSVSEDTAAA